jgi:pre-mRNA-processing factor 19
LFSIILSCAVRIIDEHSQFRLNAIFSKALRTIMALKSEFPTHSSSDNDSDATLEFMTVDVFTKEIFCGNPLAVVLVPSTPGFQLSTAAKQRIAREFNLSETIFIYKPNPERASNSRSKSSCRVDIFTTDRELPFAGHPCIGAAHVILNHFGWQIENLQLKAGTFPISLLPSGQIGADHSDAVCIKVAHEMHIHSRTLGNVLDLQAEKSGTASQRNACAKIVSSLHVDSTIREAELRAPAVSIVKGMTALLVELPSLEHLSRVSTASRLDFGEAIQGLLLDDGPWGKSFCYRYYYVSLDNANLGEKALINASREQEDLTRHIRTRMIELATEDPATGSAAVTLGAYLAMKHHPHGQKVKVEITQGVEMGRKSDIHVEVNSKYENGQTTIGELTLGGSAVVVMTGTINV